jgi:natural product biosynthesis luciferase-like monooxygenase protein
MEFGIMFFASQVDSSETEPYYLAIEAAKFADRHHFCAIWTPERHFDGFGSIFPNPSILSAALAMITSNIQLRSGSLISPLHDTVRIAEEWAVVDNLSHGRAAISFGSGWNVNDFIFFPERYTDRKKIMYAQIEVIQTLWQGGRIKRKNSFGKDVEIALHPRPFQPVLPIWITSSGSVDTFVQAGNMGANVLTHLIGQDIDTLAEKIRCYRDSYKSRHPHLQRGKVALMLHTFLGTDPEVVKETVGKPFREYLRSAVVLENKAAQGGGTISGGHKIPLQEIPMDIMEELLDVTFERYYHQAALIGTLDTCKKLVQRLEVIGVDEIACLIDFGVSEKEVLMSLDYLNDLREAFVDTAS